METLILDYWEENNKPEFRDGRVVVAKYFPFEANARVFAARLKEAGISSFISNSYTNTMIPLIDGGIGLYVKEEDLQASLEVIKKIEEYDAVEAGDYTFHEADLEDIAYEKEVNQSNRQDRGQPLEEPPFMKKSFIYLLVFFLLILLLLSALLNVSFF